MLAASGRPIISANGPRTQPRSGSGDMSILVNRHTRVLCQGITGKVGCFTARSAVIRHADGRRRDACKGGTEIDGFPVFNTVEEAVRKTEANATMNLLCRPVLPPTAIPKPKPRASPSLSRLPRGRRSRYGSRV